ncbi:MAG: Histidine kinase, gyrase and HSP90-like ATPase [Blastococcus sp.]|jgi:signal transduction histidine kinase|nr:Histidine kinase, gyrase and HSP90-like ATPase [Blastococcus sp.]
MTVSRRAAPILLALLALAGAVVPLALASARADGVPQDEATIAVAITAYAAVGLLIALARPHHPVGRLLLGGATAWAIGEAALGLAVQGLVTQPGSVPAADWLAMSGTLLRGAGWLVLVLAVPLVFPDGRLPPAPWRWAAPVTGAALACFATASLLPTTPIDDRLAAVPNPIGPPAWASGLVDALAPLSLGLALVALGGAVGGLVARWRSGGRLVRQQLLWFTLAAAVPVALLPIASTGLAGPVLFGMAVLPLPVALAVAVLQHRLYDVQLAANRTIASVALSAALAVLYVLVVAGVGALLAARGARWLPWLATGVVAVSFAPLRAALQRAANRLTYGQWAQPDAVLAGVRRRLADAGDVDRLLPELVAELADGLGLTGIAVLDPDGRVLARSGAAAADEHETELTAYGRRVGALRWSGPRRPLRDSDHRLLADIATHLGALVHAATLVSNLRSAHERLVVAREDERRRLRRDLHDGLGSALAGLTFKVEAVRNLLRTDVAAADAALGELRTGIQGGVLEVRRVVEGLRPPDLDELGLVPALTELAARLGRNVPTGICVDAPAGLPPLPPEVAAAAYRVAQEALTNVVRHAGAASCRVSVGHAGGDLSLDVTDDGSGLAAPREGAAGLPGMADRAAELGGELAIDAVPGRGTTVRLRLPAPVPAPADRPASVVAGALR